jgi:tetratricopeptide (TPR) repeat protein
MKSATTLLLAIAAVAFSASAQRSGDVSTFKIAFPGHPGQLVWHAEGFKVIERSAKANGNEIGIRGRDQTGRLTFLGFLFLVSGETPLTSLKCQEGGLRVDEKSNPTLKILATSSIDNAQGFPVALVTYTQQGADRKIGYSVRGFMATGDICGDLEFYADTPISSEDADLKKIFESYHLDLNYVPRFADVFLYAQILYQHQMYKPAAPIFEQALIMLGDDKDQLTMRRVTTDQAGMAYGISGNLAKARAIFSAAIAKDPDYPMYYYNLACADAEEENLADARTHLQQAFDRKANVIAGEKLPDPTKDDSFLPYQKNKEFWAFLETLH